MWNLEVTYLTVNLRKLITASVSCCVISLQSIMNVNIKVKYN